MPFDRYFLPDGYVSNPAVSFDKNDEIYWDQARVNNSLAYQAAAYDWALRIIRQYGLRSVADVGCGSAAKLARLRQRGLEVETWGLDQPNAIALCRKHYDFGNWFPVNFDNPESLPNKTFDLVISSDVIEHLEDPDKLLNTIRAISHPDTLILISTPERVHLRGRRCLNSPNPFHVREWSRDEFSSYLESRGAQIWDHRILPAFDCLHNGRFFLRALKRWIRFNSVAYNQVVLMKLPPNQPDAESWEVGK